MATPPQGSGAGTAGRGAGTAAPLVLDPEMQVMYEGVGMSRTNYASAR